MQRLVALLLVISLVANAWLLLLSHSPRAQPPSQQASAPLAKAPARSADTPALSSPEGPRTLSDFRTLKAEFERLGLPARTVNTLIALLVRYDSQQQLEQLAERPDPAAYWLNPNLGEQSEKTVALRERLDTDAGKLMQDLGLADFWDSIQAEEQQRKTRVELPQETFKKLRKIMSDYDDLRTPSDDPAQADLLRREMRADLERLLSPEELRQVEYRMSAATDHLRVALGNFQPTQSEFDAIFPQMKTLLGADWFVGALELSPAKQQQLDYAMRQALGEARYAEFKEINSEALKHAQQFVVDYDVPARFVPELRSVRSDLEPRLEEIRTNHDLTPRQRAQQIDTLIAEAEERLRRFLSDEQIRSYQGTAGHWLYNQRSKSSDLPAKTP